MIFCVGKTVGIVALSRANRAGLVQHLAAAARRKLSALIAMH